MENLSAIAGLIAVAAATPGPNNLLVMQRTAQSGWPAALPAITGILLGSLTMFMLTAAGIGAFLIQRPQARLLLLAGGCTYLVGLGLRLFIGSTHGGYRFPAPVTPAGGISGLFMFQFLNPKAWVMMLTAVSAIHADTRFPSIVAGYAWLFVVIPGGCLLCWSCFGLALHRYLQRESVRMWFDRGSGCVLIGCASLLLVYG